MVKIMNRAVWKSRLVCIIAFIVLISSNLAVNSTGIEETGGTRATYPEIIVSADIKEDPDFQDWYSYNSHNFTVTMFNTGDEELSNVEINLTVYTPAHTVEFDFTPDTSIQSFGIGKKEISSQVYVALFIPDSLDATNDLPQKKLGIFLAEEYTNLQALYVYAFSHHVYRDKPLGSTIPELGNRFVG